MQGIGGAASAPGVRSAQGPPAKPSEAGLSGRRKTEGAACSFRGAYANRGNGTQRASSDEAATLVPTFSSGLHQKAFFLLASKNFSFFRVCEKRKGFFLRRLRFPGRYQPNGTASPLTHSPCVSLGITPKPRGRGKPLPYGETGEKGHRREANGPPRASAPTVHTAQRRL